VTARVAGRLAWSLWSVTVALFAAALVLTAVNQGAAVRAGDELALGLAFLCFATVGALVASRRPGNAVGWICGAIGLTSVLSVAPIEYARYAQAHPGSLPAAAAVGWPAMWAWYPTLGLMTTFLLLLFPTGRLPSRRWLPVAWLAGATIAGTCLATAVKPAPPDVGLPTNPLGVEQMARPAELVELTGFVLLALGAIASVASVVVPSAAPEGRSASSSSGSPTALVPWS
jgi:hypothetical protein